MITKFNGNLFLHQVQTFDNNKKKQKVGYYNFCNKKNSNVIPFKHNSLLMVKKPLFFCGTTRV